MASYRIPIPRARYPNSSNAIPLKLILVELDAEINRCRTRLKIAPTSQLRKSFEGRIHWLERYRAKHHSD